MNLQGGTIKYIVNINILKMFFISLAPSFVTNWFFSSSSMIVSMLLVVKNRVKFVNSQDRSILFVPSSIVCFVEVVRSSIERLLTTARSAKLLFTVTEGS